MGYNYKITILKNNQICYQKEMIASYSNDNKYWTLTPDRFEISKIELEKRLKSYEINLDDVKQNIQQMTSLIEIYNYVDEVFHISKDDIYEQMLMDLKRIEYYDGDKIVYELLDP